MGAAYSIQTNEYATDYRKKFITPDIVTGWRGAKGFYTLGVLSEIEALAKEPLYKHFDLIFGTSTGAIIAALLARGETVDNVLSIYREHVPPIMKEQRLATRTKALHSHARAVFDEQTFDVFKTGIGIVATNWKDKRPFLFKNRGAQAHASKSSFVPFFGVSVADAVIASCSAYPFFDLYEVTKSNGDEVLCADGGFCANNPTLYAVADAIGPLGVARPNLRLISLGVGSYPEPKTWRKAKRLFRDPKLARHAISSTFLQTILDTNTRSMEIVSRFLFSDVQTVRIDEVFSEPDLATDLLEHDLKKLNRLTQKGRDSYRKCEADIAKLLES